MLEATGIQGHSHPTRLSMTVAALAVSAGLWCAACGGSSPSPTSPSSGGTTGQPATQTYSVQTDDETEICTLKVDGTTGGKVPITQATLAAAGCPDVYDPRVIVVRQPPAGVPGKLIAKTTTGSITDTIDGTPKVLYVSKKQEGLDIGCVLSAGFGNQLPYGRNVTVSMMGAGEMFPYPGTPVPSLGGGESQMDDVIADLNNAVTGTKNTKMMNVSRIASGGQIKAAVVGSLPGWSGWHTNTGYIASLTAADNGIRRRFMEELVEEISRANNMCGDSSAAVLYQGGVDNAILLPRGKTALRTMYLASP